MTPAPAVPSAAAPSPLAVLASRPRTPIGPDPSTPDALTDVARTPTPSVDAARIMSDAVVAALIACLPRPGDGDASTVGALDCDDGLVRVAARLTGLDAGRT